MNRRQWMKQTTLLSGMMLFSRNSVRGNELPVSSESGSEAVARIKEIHLTNFQHTDFGYTDLPSTVCYLLCNGIRQAIQYCRETEEFPVESRFKWTAESLWIVERFLNDASAKERRDFDYFVERGQIEVTAMPANITCLVGRSEWEKELDRLLPLFQKYRPTVAIQNDINGLPWGFVDSVLDRGVQRLIMAVNGHLVPTNRPSFFRWQNKAENRELLVYNGIGYASGYDYFHEEGWRRGPVPHRYDIWYNSPTENDIFKADEKSVLEAHLILLDRIDRLEHYPYEKVMLPTTNHTTIDNDVPCRQMSDFIKKWNEMGLLPRLIFTTPRVFLDATEGVARKDSPVMGGEWGDWWASGVASTPHELAILQDASRRAVDIDRAKTVLKMENPVIEKKIEELNHDLVYAAEHTWGAFDSISHPYSSRAKGCLLEKTAPFYRADEMSKQIKRDILASVPDNKPFSQTRSIEVFNPGNVARSGWVDIAASAMRFDANGATDPESGEFFPFEDLEVDNDPLSPPGGWSNHTVRKRFFVVDIPHGQRRKFQLVEEDVESRHKLKESRFFEFILDDNQSIKNVLYKPLGDLLFDETNERPGQIIFERMANSVAARKNLFSHTMKQEEMEYSVPTVEQVLHEESCYARLHEAVFQHERAKRIEQKWHLFDAIPRIEITTTIWFPEIVDPLAAFIAFPFKMDAPNVVYDSMGVDVQVGRDFLPNSCGEFHTVREGVRFHGKDFNINLATLSVPMGMFDKILRNGTRFPEPPETGRFYSMFLETYWPTNFAILSPCKLVLRHIIEVSLAGQPIPVFENDELWVYPSR